MKLKNNETQTGEGRRIRPMKLKNNETQTGTGRRIRPMKLKNNETQTSAGRRGKREVKSLEFERKRSGFIRIDR